jgi:hypothetical protein
MIFLNQCLIEEAKPQGRQKERRKVLSPIPGKAQRKCSTAQPRYVGRSSSRLLARLVGLDWIGTGVPLTWPRAESELEPTGIFRGPFPFRALQYAPVCFKDKILIKKNNKQDG